MQNRFSLIERFPELPVRNEYVHRQCRNVVEQQPHASSRPQVTAKEVDCERCWCAFERRVGLPENFVLKLGVTTVHEQRKLVLGRQKQRINDRKLRHDSEKGVSRVKFGCSKS